MKRPTNRFWKLARVIVIIALAILAIYIGIGWWLVVTGRVHVVI
jgi:hypothetical protein